MNALNNYYQRIGCNREGVFPSANLHPPITGFNGLGLSAAYVEHLPWVNEYRVQIVDTGEKTINNNPKPIYVLEVLAQLSDSLTKQQIIFLQHQLSAAFIVDRTLVWKSLPNNQVTNSGNILWVLDGARKAFRNYFSKQNLIPENFTAASNCAN